MQFFASGTDTPGMAFSLALALGMDINVTAAAFSKSSVQHVQHL